MKFCIEHVGKSSGRIGQLVVKENGSYIKTPLLLQTTKSGSIPHLSAEVFHSVIKDSQLLQLSLATTIRMAESVSKSKGENGLSRYIGFPDSSTMLIMHDPCERFLSGHSDKDVVPIFTRHGKEQITAKRYMELIECFSPDIFEGLCDADTNHTSSKKRIQKSLDRTHQFMSDCFKMHKSSEKLKRSTLFVPIVGGYSIPARTEAIKHIHSECGDDFGGYIFEGFHNYGSSALEVEETALYGVVEHCIGQLIEEKPRMMVGAYTPIVTLELIRLGVDIFDTSYPYLATKSFAALTFCFKTNREHEEDMTSPYLDLTDEGYKEDFGAIISDCDCLTCKKHSRAYVHHLYKTRELLGPILLMIHNLHHYMEFFKTIRQCIAANRLPELLMLIKKQNGQNEINYRFEENKISV